jgi:hypothetical protein
MARVRYVPRDRRRDGGPVTGLVSGVMPFVIVNVFEVVLPMWFSRLALRR